jgi:type I restriction enzyme S subunit
MSESEWVEGVLSDLVMVNPDKPSAIAHLDEFRYVDIGCISAEGLRPASEIEIVARVEAPSRAQRRIIDGDVLVGTVRPEREARGRVGVDMDGQVASSGICVLRPKSAKDSGFIYSIVRDTSFTDWCVNHSTGTSYPAVSSTDIGRYPLVIPPQVERERIAEVLGALDDRIEITRRLITLLSATAQALSAMSPSTCAVGDLATTERLQWYPDRHPGAIVDHYSLPAFDSGAGAERVEAHLIASNKLLVGGPRVLFSRLNPDTNRTWLCVPALEVSASVCSTEYAVLSPTTTSVAQLWAVLSSGEVGDLLAAATTGTSASHQRVREDAVLGATVADPRALSTEDRLAIDAYADTVVEKVREVKSLREARDFLLPRLLTGELRVRDAEEFSEATL